jgi:hypothetical protein
VNIAVAGRDLRKPGAVELLLEPGPSPVRLAQGGDECVDRGCLVAPGCECAHFRESSRGESVVLGASLDEFVLDEALVDGENGEWVELLVGRE